MPRPKGSVGILKEGKVTKSGNASGKKSEALVSITKLKNPYQTVIGDDILNVKVDTNKKTVLPLPANLFQNNKKNYETNQSSEKIHLLGQKSPCISSTKTFSQTILESDESKKLIDKPFTKEQKWSSTFNDTLEQDKYSSSGLHKHSSDNNNQGKEEETNKKISSAVVNHDIKLKGMPLPKLQITRMRHKRKLVDPGKIIFMKKDNSSSSSTDRENIRRKKTKKRKRPTSRIAVEGPFVSIFERINIENAVKALLRSLPFIKKRSYNSKFIYLNFNLCKGSSRCKENSYVLLPHSVIPEPAKVCLITNDIEYNPQNTIDFYSNLMKEKGIDYLSKIIPLKKIRWDYKHFDERTRLANQFDAVLLDSSVGKMSRFAHTERCLSAVKLSADNLKVEFDKALRMVTVFNSGRDLSYYVKCGRIGMSPEDINDNITAIGEFFVTDRKLIGQKLNIYSAYIRTNFSKPFPIYKTVLKSNAVIIPKTEETELAKPVEDEVTTAEDATVLVCPPERVRVKKRKTKILEAHDKDKKKQKTKVDIDDNKMLNLNKPDEPDNYGIDEEVDREYFSDDEIGKDRVYDADESEFTESMNDTKDTMDEVERKDTFPEQVEHFKKRKFEKKRKGKPTFSFCGKSFKLKRNN